MMSKEDLESYLIRLELDFEEVEECLWVIKGAEGNSGAARGECIG